MVFGSEVEESGSVQKNRKKNNEEEEENSLESPPLLKQCHAVFLSYSFYSSFAFFMIFQGIIFQSMNHRWKTASKNNDDGMDSTNKSIFQHSCSLIGFFAIVFRICHNVVFRAFQPRQRLYIVFGLIIMAMGPFLCIFYLVFFMVSESTSESTLLFRSPWWMTYICVLMGIAMGTCEPNLQKCLPADLKKQVIWGNSLGYSGTAIVGFALLSLHLSLSVVLCFIFVSVIVSLLTFHMIVPDQSPEQLARNHAIKRKKLTVDLLLSDDDKNNNNGVNQTLLLSDSSSASMMSRSGSEIQMRVSISDAAAGTRGNNVSNAGVTAAGCTPGLLSDDMSLTHESFASEDVGHSNANGLKNDDDEMDESLYEWMKFKQALREWREWLPPCLPHFAAFSFAIFAQCCFNSVSLYFYDGNRVPLWRKNWMSDSNNSNAVWISTMLFFSLSSCFNVCSQFTGSAYVYSRFALLGREKYFNYHLMLLCCLLCIVGPMAAGQFDMDQVPLLVLIGIAGIYAVNSTVMAVSVRYFDTFVSDDYRLACFSLWYLSADIGNTVGFNLVEFLVDAACNGGGNGKNTNHQWHCKDV